MATSPTVLAGASASSPPISAPISTSFKFPVIPLLVAVITGAAIAAAGAGGVVYYLARTGRLSMQSGTARKAEAVLPVSTHAMVLEPLLVNLGDAGGSSYLRVALTLRIADAGGKNAKAKDLKGGDKNTDEAVAAVRDTILTVLGRQTADGLLAVDGKEHLKVQLKTALAEHNADVTVLNIFFTDFLVQR
jgi:flagellar FliL protein